METDRASKNFWARRARFPRRSNDNAPGLVAALDALSVANVDFSRETAADCHMTYRINGHRDEHRKMMRQYYPEATATNATYDDAHWDWASVPPVPRWPCH